jgi:hypothetical protein
MRVLWLMGMALLAAGMSAQLSTADRAAASEMVGGKLYLKIDAPCDHSRLAPMVEVSPTGVNLETKISEVTAEDRPNVFWRFGPNDPVNRCVLRFGVDRIRVWGEGVAPKSNEFVIEFVQIRTLADFKRAFDLTFSPVPLQDAHPEWPAEIRQAIAARRLVEGMTPEQVRCVIGAPLSVKASQEGGALAEIWRPRQENGLRKLFGNANLRTGFPASLKFEGGKLTVIEAAPSAAKGK